MLSRKASRGLYLLLMILLFLFPATFLAMPIPSLVLPQYMRLAQTIVGATFWVSGIGGYSLLIYFYHIYSCARDKESEQDKRKIYWYSNGLTSVADTCFIIGIVLFVLFIIKRTTHYIVYVNIFVTVLSFNAHLLFSRKFY